MFQRRIVWFATLLFLASAALGEAQITRMSKEQLKPLLGTPQVVVLDLRVEPVWRSSASKISGAIREEPSGVDSWARKYPKEKTYVLYCS